MYAGQQSVSAVAFRTQRGLPQSTAARLASPTSSHRQVRVSIARAMETRTTANPSGEASLAALLCGKPRSRRISQSGQPIQKVELNILSKCQNLSGPFRGTPIEQK